MFPRGRLLETHHLCQPKLQPVGGFIIHTINYSTLGLRGGVYQCPLWWFRLVWRSDLLSRLSSPGQISGFKRVVSRTRSIVYLHVVMCERLQEGVSVSSVSSASGRFAVHIFAVFFFFNLSFGFKKYSRLSCCEWTPFCLCLVIIRAARRCSWAH